MEDWQKPAYLADLVERTTPQDIELETGGYLELVWRLTLQLKRFEEGTIEISREQLIAVHEDPGSADLYRLSWLREKNVCDLAIPQMKLALSSGKRPKGGDAEQLYNILSEQYKNEMDSLVGRLISDNRG